MSGTAPADDIEDEAPAEAGPRPAVAAGKASDASALR